jgi:hypothetical protein
VLNGVRPRYIRCATSCSASNTHRQAAEQEYILKAYEEDVEMRDADADEAEVEQELDGISRPLVLTWPDFIHSYIQKMKATLMMKKARAINALAGKRRKNR